MDLFGEDMHKTVLPREQGYLGHQHFLKGLLTFKYEK